jgi:acyl-CoA thioesterase
MDPLSEQSLSARVVKRMLDNDPFSRWLGINVLELGPGKCILSMVLRPEMMNGFSIAHGGISYSLADSCLAFAANGHGMQSVSLETSIAHLSPVRAGDILISEAKEEHRTRRTAHYRIEIREKENNTIVALFKGIIYITEKPWFPEEAK